MDYRATDTREEWTMAPCGSIGVGDTASVRKSRWMLVERLFDRVRNRLDLGARLEGIRRRASPDELPDGAVDQIDEERAVPVLPYVDAAGSGEYRVPGVHRRPVSLTMASHVEAV